MSRRRLILPAGVAVGLIVWAGCQSRVNPVPTTPGVECAILRSDHSLPPSC